MSTKDSNSEQTTNTGKPISNFKNDGVNGENIVGGGKENFVPPTPEEEALGINNSGFTNIDSDGVTFADDGTVVSPVDDGTVKPIGF